MERRNAYILGSFSIQPSRCKMQYLLSSLVLAVLAWSFYRDGSTAVLAQSPWFYISIFGCLLGLVFFAKTRHWRRLH